MAGAADDKVKSRRSATADEQQPSRGGLHTNARDSRRNNSELVAWGSVSAGGGKCVRPRTLFLSVEFFARRKRFTPGGSRQRTVLLTPQMRHAREAKPSPAKPPVRFKWVAVMRGFLKGRRKREWSFFRFLDRRWRQTTHVCVCERGRKPGGIQRNRRNAHRPLLLSGTEQGGESECSAHFNPINVPATAVCVSFSTASRRPVEMCVWVGAFPFPPSSARCASRLS